MKTRILTLSNRQPVRIIEDGDARIVRDARTDEYITRVFRVGTKWRHREHEGKYDSIIRAIEGAVAYQEIRLELGRGPEVQR